MGSKNHTLFEALTKDEQASLKKLCGCCGCNESIPDEHADKFLGLGLAELNQGSFCATRTGRQIVSRLAN